MYRRATLAAGLAVAATTFLGACHSAGDTQEQNPPPPSEAAPSSSPAGASPSPTRPARNPLPIDPSLSASPRPSQANDVAKSIVGQSEAIAVRVIEGYGYTWRVTARDGESFPLTMDYYEGRINIAIENGTVVSADVG